MDKYKFIILGAGPAGLTFANRLKDVGINDFLVIEKEKEAGGLCRSMIVDGAPLDIGGGHFLDVRNQEANDYLYHFMPREEWNLFRRDSRIRLKEYEIGHPFEANIWQLPDDVQKQYLESISKAGCNNGEIKPKKFIEWISWKLGDRIASDYMIPYNRKLFSDDLNELGIYWLDKLPDVSYDETLKSCKDHKPYGKEPGHEVFLYPKEHGYGEVWKRMANRIVDNIVFNKKIDSFDIKRKIVKSGDESWEAEMIITTIPWQSINIVKGFTKKTIESLKELKHCSVEIKYCEKTLDTKAHWIYFPSEEVDFHRILVRSNFCSGSKGCWTETRQERINNKYSAFKYINEYAYPLNTIDKPEIMKNIILESESNSVYPLGRWGEHMHYNSDVTVLKALQLFERINNEKII